MIRRVFTIHIIYSLISMLSWNAGLTFLLRSCVESAKRQRSFTWGWYLRLSLPRQPHRTAELNFESSTKLPLGHRMLCIKCCLSLNLPCHNFLFHPADHHQSAVFLLIPGCTALRLVGVDARAWHACQRTWMSLCKHCPTMSALSEKLGPCTS